jgi:hypothetical protein
MSKEIIEGNKLIDIFMNPKHTIFDYWINWNDGHGSLSHVETLEYHTSWDWLMPVVEKINKTKIPDNKFPANVIIYRTTCHINDDNQILVETASRGSLIICVWEAVIQFITWYNQQNT